MSRQYAERRAHSCKCAVHSTQGTENAGAVRGSGRAFLGCWDDHLFLTAKDAKGAKRGKNFSRKHRIFNCVLRTEHCVLKCTGGSAQGAEKRLGNGDGLWFGVPGVLGRYLFLFYREEPKDTKKGKNFSRRHRTSLCTVNLSAQKAVRRAQKMLGDHPFFLPRMTRRARRGGKNFTGWHGTCFLLPPAFCALRTYKKA